MEAVVEIDDVNAIHERELALLCLIENEEVWIPKSQISPDSEVREEGDFGTLIMSEWLAIQKELV